MKDGFCTGHPSFVPWIFKFFWYWMIMDSICFFSCFQFVCTIRAFEEPRMALQYKPITVGRLGIPDDVNRLAGSDSYIYLVMCRAWPICLWRREPKKTELWFIYAFSESLPTTSLQIHKAIFSESDILALVTLHLFKTIWGRTDYKGHESLHKQIK